MMTRREKLLTRPWQLRRYNNHKRKVLNAGPVIDFGPPPQRNHVTVKLKKLQQERERQSKIAEDNFKLLQHLGAIMTSKRVDNYWEKEPPNFLRRVCIYHRTRTPTPCLETPASASPVETGTTRKSKCHACVPQPEKIILIPEERVPWEPPKKILTRRQSGSAVCPVLSDFDFDRSPVKKSPAHQKTAKPVPSGKAADKKSKTGLPIIKGNQRKLERPDQSIVLRQGQLQVVVNFPTFAEVKIVRGKNEKFLQRNFCECKSLPPARIKIDKR